MKFPQLPMDRRFRWRGAIYRKGGPLTAYAEADGAATMVPRSAVVEPLGDAVSETPPVAGGPRRPEAVAEALDRLIAHIGAAADGLDAADAARIHDALREARGAFAERVGL